MSDPNWDILGDFTKESTAKAYLMDPRCQPATHFSKISDSAFNQTHVNHCGSRNPQMKLLLAMGASLDSKWQVLTLWADELGAVVPKNEDVIAFASDGVKWRVKSVEAKLFGNKFDCTCVQEVGL